MRYWPLVSVTAVRDFSIRLGLEASTVTPGSTASDASRTTPARVACANESEGKSRTEPTRAVTADRRLMQPPPRETLRSELPEINQEERTNRPTVQRSARLHNTSRRRRSSVASLVGSVGSVR